MVCKLLVSFATIVKVIEDIYKQLINRQGGHSSFDSQVCQVIDTPHHRDEEFHF